VSFSFYAMTRHTLILSNGVVGAEKQCFALAERIGLPVMVRHPPLTRAPTPVLARLAQQQLGQNMLGLGPLLLPPHPTIAISCGRASIPASIALRTASRGAVMTIHIQRPACEERLFDLVVAPVHDYESDLSVPANVLLTDGALHRVGPATLRVAHSEWAAELQPLPSPRLAVLVGGEVTRRFWQRPLAPAITAASLVALLRSATAAVAPHGGSVLLATSRRTPAEACALATRFLSEADECRGLAWRAWPADATPNPYLGLLAWADHLLVTPDSINMVTEACGAAAPVYVPNPRACRGRFLAFHERMIANGRTREWRGALEQKQPRGLADVLWDCREQGEVEVEDDDTTRAAVRVQRLLEARSRTTLRHVTRQDNVDVGM